MFSAERAPGVEAAQAGVEGDRLPLRAQPGHPGGGSGHRAYLVQLHLRVRSLQGPLRLREE
eukprot:7747778-Pyramimonas_sp.AAC.1